MTPNALAAAAAHQIAAELVRLDLAPPDREIIGVAIVEHAGLRVVVSLTKWDGPARLFLAPGVDAGEFPGAIPAPPSADQRQSAPLSAKLRDVEQAAYEATGETPVTAKRLATLAGYCNNSYFRDAVRRLVDMGLIVRCTGGVKRA